VQSAAAIERERKRAEKVAARARAGVARAEAAAIAARAAMAAHQYYMGMTDPAAQAADSAACIAAEAWIGSGPRESLGRSLAATPVRWRAGDTHGRPGCVPATAGNSTNGRKQKAGNEPWGVKSLRVIPISL
jgi:hypothetical protein